jgi:hypothetical protein
MHREVEEIDDGEGSVKLMSRWVRTGVGGGEGGGAAEVAGGALGLAASLVVAVGGVGAVRD